MLKYYIYDKQQEEAFTADWDNTVIYFDSYQEALETYKILMNNFNYSIKSIDFEKELKKYWTKLDKVYNKLVPLVNSYELESFSDVIYDLVDIGEPQELYTENKERIESIINPKNFDRLIKGLHELWNNIKDDFIFKSPKDNDTDYKVIDGVKYIDDNTDRYSSIDLYDYMDI